MYKLIDNLIELLQSMENMDWVKLVEVGLIPDNEYQTKIANLYQSYSRPCHSTIEAIMIKKLEG
jgi:hypothetical protein